MDKQLARLFALLVLVCGTAFAQTPNQTQQVRTYYVDAVTPGNDANAGTAASPFATVAHVASIAPTGNARVFVKLPNLSWNLLSMPYLNLKALWLGQQGASATTLYDVANAANNLTITSGAWSSVQGIPGLVCNGTSTVAQKSGSVIGNADFAAYVVAVSPTQSGAFTWAEGNTTDNNPMLAIDAGNQFNRISDISAHGGWITPPSLPSPSAQATYVPHVYSLMRNGTTLGYAGIPDFPSTTPGTLALTSVNITTDTEAVCARVTTSVVNYWAGTVQAVAIYLTFPNAATANAQYDGLQKFVSSALNLRMNLRQYNETNLSAGPVWVRKGGVTGLIGSGPQEPAAFYDPINSHCTLVSATSGCVRMVYTAAGTANLYYAESVDPNGLAWTDLGTAVISGHQRSAIIHVGSTLYSYSSNLSTSVIDLYTSPDTGTPVFTLAASGVIPLGSAGQIDSRAIYNTWVEPNASGTGYEMMYECGSDVGGGGYNSGAAVSADLMNWTKVSTLPNNNYDPYNSSGAFFKIINGRYYMWSDGYATGNTDIYNSVSNSLAGNWQRYPYAPTYPRGSVGEASQVADVMILDLTAVPGWGSTYMWYGANDGAGGFTMKLATTSLTIPQIVLTTEGATTTSP